jgi:iron complex transport system ATP-binding protein
MTLAFDALAVRFGARTAVAPCSAELEPGCLVALAGPNGAGKSSLLRAIAGLVPTSGTIAWAGQSLAALPGRARARLVAYLPQAPQAHWPVSVRDLVALGRLPHQAYGRAPDAGDRSAVHEAMRQTQVEALAERRVDELSGGERARVQLARALAVEAEVLLVDEPVTSLDPYHQLQIMSVLAAAAARGALVVTVLHDLTLAARFAGRVILMHEGSIVADGAPRQVLREETIRRYYRVAPYLAEVERTPLVVPWSRLG